VTADSTKTLLRGLRVIEALATSGTALGPTAIAKELDVGKATASRLLRTLESAGYAQRLSNGSYLLTERMYGLVSECHVNQDLRGVAQPYLQALRDATEETVHLGILDGSRIVVIDRYESTHPVRLETPIGHTCPLHCTGLGKAALAFLPADRRLSLSHEIDYLGGSAFAHTDPSSLLEDLDKTRERGYAIDDRESAEHAYCVAAPVLLQTGELRAVISISGPSYRLTEQHELLGRRCQQVANEIAKAVGRTTLGPAAR
jgi:DNA-binding IclR family transcriptional regulator